VREHSYVSVRVCVWLQTGEKHIDVVYLVHMFVSVCVCVCVCVGELPRIHLQHICAHISESSRRERAQRRQHHQTSKKLLKHFTIETEIIYYIYYITLHLRIH